MSDSISWSHQHYNVAVKPEAQRHAAWPTEVASTSTRPAAAEQTFSGIVPDVLNPRLKRPGREADL